MKARFFISMVGKVSKYQSTCGWSRIRLTQRMQNNGLFGLTKEKINF